MTLNVSDSGEHCWESSLYMAAPYHPAKFMFLETELGSGRREHLQPVSMTHLSPDTQNTGSSPEIPDGPVATPMGIYQVDLPDWYPRYTSCVRYFLNEGQHSPFVQSLAAFINIRLPCQRLSDPIMNCTETAQDPPTSPPTSASGRVSLRPYIRRLIVTGHDMPSILEAFFGDDWLGGVGPVCKQERLNYLFTAKSSGWSSTKAAYDILPDEHAPFLRPPREASEDELRLAESQWSEWLALEDWMVGPRSPWG